MEKPHTAAGDPVSLMNLPSATSEGSWISFEFSLVEMKTCKLQTSKRSDSSDVDFFSFLLFKPGSKQVYVESN